MAIGYTNNMDQHNITWKELRQGDQLITPFQLALTDCDFPLICDEVIRIVPGIRFVAFGTWDNKPVVAKVFYERGSANRHAMRDTRGVKVLKMSVVPTPELLFQGTAQNKKIHVLLFERIMHADSLDTIWHQKKNLAEVTPLLQAVTIELATQHVLGIIQRDLHLKNFLVTDKNIYTLDGAGIQRTDGILPKRESLDHLALFFSQLGVGTEKLQHELFQLYLKSRGWQAKKTDVKFLNLSIESWTRKRWVRFEKKIQRNSSTFCRKKLTHATAMFDRAYLSDEFTAFLNDPDQFIQRTNTKMLKQGNSTTVVKLRIGDHILVVKRYNIKGTLHWLKRCLRASRAARSWRFAQCLQLFGVATAKPVAYIENRFFGLRGTSYFIMEWVEGQHIGDYFLAHSKDKEKLTLVAERVMNMLLQLKKLRLTHGDLKMTNILIHQDRPVLIDLDGMKEHRSVFILQHFFRKEVRRFMRNWDNMPTAREIFSAIFPSY